MDDPQNMPDPIIVTWAAAHLFSHTINRDGGDSDESDDHIIHTFESRHPYKARDKYFGCITVPCAKKISIQFDKRSQSDGLSDSLTFYEDEDCTKIAHNPANRKELIF